ncbi:MAG: hypothetical protein E7494_13750 [Ruminococcus albus]|jgi:hypothetical protein|nr:hypothetical protein [Ruminococcus albus]
MDSEKLRYQMILAGVSLTDLAEKLGIPDEELTAKMNAEMTVMEQFKVASAISDIIVERGKG